MVHTLDKISHEEDRSQAFGHIAVILEEYDLAEKYFLESSNRIEGKIISIILTIHCELEKRDELKM